jgi:hypothetical protein
MFETASDRADRIYLFVYGQSGHRQVGTFLTLLPDGAVHESQPVRDPFEVHDPGSPGHLRGLLSATRPALMYDGPAALIVYVHDR